MSTSDISPVGFRIKINRVVGTCLHTGLAPDANGRIKFDDPIAALIHRADGADAHAGRVRAMITARHLEAAAHVGIRARLGILDPCTIYAKWHLILRLARGGAGVTSNTFALVNQKSIIGHDIL
jgi:hypothetical protein